MTEPVPAAALPADPAPPTSTPAARPGRATHGLRATTYRKEHNP